MASSSSIVKPASGSLDLSVFTAFDPVPEAGIRRANEIDRAGMSFRYSGKTAFDNEAALLERDLAGYLGVKYVLVGNSCTSMIVLALTMLGAHGRKVLMPAFTFIAVPSAIHACGAEPVLVECTPDYKLDVKDLEDKMVSSGAKLLLLSHMRGHISNMDAIGALCTAHDVTMIEDAAHAFGAWWDGERIGTFGTISCFSTQGNKLMNAGEGGILATDNPELYAHAILLSGAYEDYWRKHFAGNDIAEKDSAVAEFIGLHRGTIPLPNIRMTNTAAAKIRAQLPLVTEKGIRYREMYDHLENSLVSNRVQLPRPYPKELRIPDSLQLRIVGASAAQMQEFVRLTNAAGLPFAAFASEGNARNFENWKFLGKKYHLPKTAKALATAVDMRLPSTLTPAHLAYIITTVREAVSAINL